MNISVCKFCLSFYFSVHYIPIDKTNKEIIEQDYDITGCFGKFKMDSPRYHRIALSIIKDKKIQRFAYLDFGNLQDLVGPTRQISGSLFVIV